MWVSPEGAIAPSASRMRHQSGDPVRRRACKKALNRECGSLPNSYVAGSSRNSNPLSCRPVTARPRLRMAGHCRPLLSPGGLLSRALHTQGSIRIGRSSVRLRWRCQCRWTQHTRHFSTMCWRGTCRTRPERMVMAPPHRSAMAHETRLRNRAAGRCIGSSLPALRITTWDPTFGLGPDLRLVDSVWGISHPAVSR